MEADSKVKESQVQVFSVDQRYEFSAPHYFDLSKEETGEEAAAAERWFQADFSYPASPQVVKLKSVRELSMGCSLEEYIEVQKLVARVSSEFPKDMQAKDSSRADFTSTGNIAGEEISVPSGLANNPMKDEPCTPKMQSSQNFAEAQSNKPVDCAHNVLSKQHYSAHNVLSKQHYSDLQKPTAKVATTVKKIKNSIPRSSKTTNAKRSLVTTQKMCLGEEQAKKKQKLEDGASGQVWNAKKNLPLSKIALTVPQQFHFSTQKRAQVYKDCGQCFSTKVEAEVSPFISLAERIQRFQLSTSGQFRRQNLNPNEFIRSRNRILRLTRPKEPELRTSVRARPSRVKSSAEIEEELLANIPKFKACPLNKRILEGPTLPALPRSIPQVPEFQEFNLRTMERALVHYEASSSMNFESRGNREKHVSSQGEPHLETTARARPNNMKTTEEMEMEELAMMPKFKARPLNKRIFSSRGDVGIFPVVKRQQTIPQEFHFATDERAQYHNVAFSRDKFKLDNQAAMRSLNLIAQKEECNLQHTVTEPFHLATEERGLIKERKFQTDLLTKDANEQRARIPKANPLPYTIDFPDIPFKPKPRESTKPEPFQLEGLIRHEQNRQLMMEEHIQAERETAERRAFHAQPISCNVPVFVPDKSRKPLTEIQPFVFRAEARVPQREQFTRQLLEKRKNYEHQKEQQEAARKADEDRAMLAFQRENAFHPRAVPKFDSPFVPARSMKELTQPMTPNITRPKDFRELHKLSFPVCYMR